MNTDQNVFDNQSENEEQILQSIRKQNQKYRSHVKAQSNVNQKQKDHNKLPQIKKNLSSDRNRLKTQCCIYEILQETNNNLKFNSFDKHSTPKKKRGVSNINTIKCGRVKCDSCNPQNKNTISLKHKKKRQKFYSHPNQNDISNQIYQNKVKKIPHRKISYFHELNNNGKFNLIPLYQQQNKTAKKKRSITSKQIEHENDYYLKTFFQKLKINGKIYFVKKKKKVYRTNKPQPKNNPKLMFQISGDEGNQHIINHNYEYIDNREYIKEQKEIKAKEKRRKNQHQNNNRKYLNQEARRLIHFETHFQKMDNSQNQDEIEKRMELNRNYEEDQDYSKAMNYVRKYQGNQNQKDDQDGIRQNIKIFNQSRIKEQENYSIKFPNHSELNQSINNYVPLTKDIDIFLLKKKSNFIKQYSDTAGREFFYFGEFNNQRKFREGKGVLVTKKRVLEGEWRNGQIAEGAELKENGVYYGQFQDRHKHGDGTYEWINGQKYRGQWKYGKRHGTGIWKSRLGQLYNGEWKEGKATGYGEFKTNDEGIFKGKFVNFIKQGPGREILPNGDIYAGDYENGKAHGYGKYIWKNGLVYEGQFINNKREGRGKLKFPQIFKLEGNFKKGLPHGMCKLELENGDDFSLKYSYGDPEGFKTFENDSNPIKYF